MVLNNENTEKYSCLTGVVVLLCTYNELQL